MGTDRVKEFVLQKMERLISAEPLITLFLQGGGTLIPGPVLFV